MFKKGDLVKFTTKNTSRYLFKKVELDGANNDHCVTLSEMIKPRLPINYKSIMEIIAYRDAWNCCVVVWVPEYNTYASLSAHELKLWGAK